MDWSNCPVDDNVYAELKNRIAAKQDDHFVMELNRSDYAVFAQAWNMGIDSHLEALTERSSVEQAGHKADCLIHPEELPVLVRRLYEISESEDHTDEEGPALGLATSILYVLNIEDE